MRKFYRELPDEVIDILSISSGWLIGSSIKHILDKIAPNDFDIIVSEDNYRSIFRSVNKYSPKFNNHGGINVKINSISIDIWTQSLDKYLLNVGNQFTYAYNFNKNLFLSNGNLKDIKTPQQIIDQYPYVGAFLGSAQGNEVAIKLIEEYHNQF